MSAQVCPVCGGKGLVPNGFYDVGSSNLGNYRQKTTSASPETCRSCQGKGYIIVTPNPNHFIANTLNCSNCDNNDRMCYTSNPPQYKCIVDNTFHFAYDSCDKYKEQETGQTFTNVQLLNHQDK